MTNQIHFLLNDCEISTSESPGLLVLDYLRHHAKLMGTKEGCKEGDCGACTVLLGELIEEKLSYKAVTSCLMPLGELQGKHLVTIEGLNMDELSIVQRAIVEKGATQCGFCTPGIVVSLTGHLMTENSDLSLEGIKEALSGHLCRCTGYSSLKRAGKIIIEDIEKIVSGKDMTRIEALVKNKALPQYFLDIPERMKKMKSAPFPEQEADFIIAGGTDIYVQKGEEIPCSKVNLLNLHPELKQILKKDDSIHVGALVTFQEFSKHKQISKNIPDIENYLLQVASLQIRNRATLGGNIVNASPIADLTILLLALGSILELEYQGKIRNLPLKDFYLGYKKLNKEPKELVRKIIIPTVSSENKINFEKISKRKYLDIATVNSAIKICLKENKIDQALLAVGGVAPTPLLLKKTNEYLKGKTISVDTVIEAFSIADQEISPISDVRGAADYKRLLVRQLIMAHFCKLFPETVKAREIYEKL